MANLSDAVEWVVKRISALTRTATDADLTDGEFVAVDKTDGYTRKMTVASLATWVLGKIKNLPTTITSFRSGDTIPVDGPNGPAKMQSSDLQTAILGGPINEAVQQWLNEHPEATTTVEDHSLTYKKLINGTLNFVTPEMFGAVGDGVTDDTAAIQAAMDACSVVVFGDKTYVIDVGGEFSGLKCNNGQKLYLGNCTLQAKLGQNTSGKYNIIYTDWSDNIEICGGHIVGDNDDHPGTSGEWGNGIGINSSNNVTVRNVEISKCWGDGIGIYPLWDPTIPWADMPWDEYDNNIVVAQCHIHDCRRQGISVINGKHITIEDCVIHDISGTAPQFGIDIEPDGGRNAEYVTISRTYIYNCGTSEKNSIALTNGNNQTVVDCILAGQIVTDASSNIHHYTIINTDIVPNKGSDAQWFALLNPFTKTEFINCKIPSLQIWPGAEVILKDCEIGGRDPALNFLRKSSTGDNNYKFTATGCTFINDVTAFSAIGYFGSDNSKLSFTNCKFVPQTPYVNNSHLEIPISLCEFVKCEFIFGKSSFAAVRVRGADGNSANAKIVFDGCAFNEFVESVLRVQSTYNSKVCCIVSNCIFENLDKPIITFRENDQVLGDIYLHSSNNKFVQIPSSFVNKTSSLAAAVRVYSSGDYYEGMLLSGPSTDRPTGLPADCTGYQYFDIDLGKMIVWNGTAWANADGTALS